MDISNYEKRLKNPTAITKTSSHVEDEEKNTEPILLTDLPLDVIVAIFDHLSLSDKYNASMSCKLLLEAFNHPYIWRTQQLLILSDEVVHFACMLGVDAPLPDKSKRMMEKFGKYFQFLTIKVLGRITRLRLWTSQLLTLSQQCRLEKLRLDVGKMPTDFDSFGNPANKDGLKILLSFISNAFQMKSFEIKSWPIFASTTGDQSTSIFRTIRNNQTFKDLEHFELFFPNPGDMWFHRLAVSPECSEVLHVIRHLPSLKTLAVRSNMLSSAILEELSYANRSRLKLLKIFVTYSKHDVRFQIPYIPPSCWIRLVQANPETRIECYVMPIVTNFELSKMLTADCPLSKIVFLRWAHLDSQLTESLRSKYNQTLTTFEAYCDIQNLDEAIINMVEECSMLHNLVLEASTSYGIHQSTVLKLASIRGQEWKTLRFCEENISFVNKPEMAFDEDALLSRNLRYDRALAGLHNYQIEPTRSDWENAQNILKEILSSLLPSQCVARNQNLVKNW